MFKYRLHNGGIDTILPDIIDVAEKHGLSLKKVQGRNEYRTNCPFCGDKASKLYLNSEKNTFNCYHGGCPSKAGKGSGGVVNFIALLTSDSETSVMDHIKEANRERKGYQNQKKPNKPKHPIYSHPARNLTAVQRELMDMKGPSFYQYIKLVEEGKITYEQVKNQLDFEWQEWQVFINREREYALLKLYAGIFEGRYGRVIEHLKEREKEIGVKLVEPALKVYSQPRLTKEVMDIRKRAYRIYVETQLKTAIKVS